MRLGPLLGCVLGASLIASALSVPPTVQAHTADINRVIRLHAAQFSGTILVAKKGKPIFHESFGLASRQFDVPNANRTRFKIASITKLFTSVITLRLHEEGKLSLHTPIAAYLPGCAGQVGSNVTVHQLLTHTSGMKDVVAVKSKEDAVRNGIDLYQRPYTVNDILMKFCDAPLENRPGTTFSYNNGDYIVLGKIIEALEGEAFEKVLRRRVLQPLQMHDSGMIYQHQVVTRLANTYFTRDTESGVLSNDLPVYDENWYAAGAMYSTAMDLREFSDALFGGRLLKGETLALLMQPGRDDYGYGVWVRENSFAGRKVTTVMRPGQIMGANTVLYRVVQAGLTVIVLSNTDTSNVDGLAREVSKAALE